MKQISVKEACIGCGFCEVHCIVKHKPKDPLLSHPLSPCYVSDFRDCLYGYSLSLLENK